MNKRVVIMLLLAVVMAGGAALVANNWLTGQLMTGEDSKTGMVAVVAAAVEIPYGQKIELAHLKMIELPEKSLPTGVYRDTEKIVGMISGQAILPGEVILHGRIVEHLGGNTLAAVIEPGMRAVTVRVNEIIGVAGFLLPGNRVDVLASKNTRNRNVSISTVLQDIKVLAVDQTASTAKNEPVVVRAVTLEVSPEQAETLVKATGEGKVQLALRNPNDDLNVVEAAPVVKKPTKRVYQAPKVTMIRGTNVSSTKVRE